MVQLVQKLETAKLKELNNELFQLFFFCTQQIIRQRTSPFFITHIRSHTSLPDPLRDVIKRWTGL